MQFLDFKQKLNDFVVFSLKDIQSFDPDFNLVQLSQWQDKGYIKKIIKGRYIFSDLELDEQRLFLVANKILSPSYISLETALSWYNLIPEGVYTITSVSTVRRIDYETDLGNFSYKKIKNSAFFGDRLVEIPGLGQKYRIASIEKALIDYLYYKDNVNSFEDIEGLRLNSEIMNNMIDVNLMIDYGISMNNKELVKRVETLIKYFGK